MAASNGSMPIPGPPAGIGIGAGPDCDAQVQVVSDRLGLYTDFVPKHARQYANLAETIGTATRTYMADVRAGRYPAAASAVSSAPGL